MRFSVGYDLGSFFSGLGEEGKHLSYLADYLIVTKNNYYWSKPYDNLDFIANGDIAEIIRVGKYYELYGVIFNK